ELLRIGYNLVNCYPSLFSQHYVRSSTAFAPVARSVPTRACRPRSDTWLLSRWWEEVRPLPSLSAGSQRRNNRTLSNRAHHHERQVEIRPYLHVSSSINSAEN